MIINSCRDGEYNIVHPKVAILCDAKNYSFSPTLQDQAKRHDF